MGQDLHGQVEIRGPLRWRAVVDAGNLLERDSWAHGVLFGQGRVSLFEPLFAGRGLPDDVSGTTREVAEGLFAPSWFTLAELEAVDLDVLSERPWVEEHREDPDGTTSLVRTYSRNPLEGPAGERLAAEGELREGDRRWTLEHVSRREALAGFRVLFEILEVLGRHHGPENVRLVVGFDV